MIGETTRFGPPLPLTAAIVDQQAALYGLDCVGAGDLKCTYGTGAFVMANIGQTPRRSQVGLPASVAWRLDGETTYCLDGPVFAAASAIDWLRDIGLLTAPADLDRCIERSKANEIMFVPALAGWGPPSWSPQPGAAWLGMSLATTGEDLISAATWGIAAQVASLVELIEFELGQATTQLLVDGGLARSDALLQAQADLLGIPVLRSATREATALGVGKLASLGVGSPFAQALSIARTFEPQLSSDEAEAALARWQHAARRVHDLGQSP
jgi:glycerol kinase